MARTTVIAPEAWEEINKAFDWSERQEPGLRDRFFKALNRSIGLATSDPGLCPLRFDQVRRIMLRKFPHAVYFESDEQVRYVLSVFHESRNPSHLDRLRKP